MSGAPWIRGLAAVLALALGVALAPGAAPAAASGAVAWESAPAIAPPPPPGTAPASYPVPLGKVGDISFWAPNRGLLITEGDPPTVSAGLYAYNGEDWHELSTVCGGGEGRIVWAGPDEFWTISNQRSLQLSNGGNDYTDLSLCHFLNGQVVGSYAEPFDQPDSYQEMDAGACLSPDNCWFGGALGQAPNYGAFHLHWDGQNVSVVYAPQDHAIASMALANESTLLESVQLNEGDSFEGEEPEQPTLLHQVDNPNSTSLFADIFLDNSACTGICTPLPEYGLSAAGHPVDPLTLGPFALSSDYSPAEGNGATAQLWALAAPVAEPPANLPSSKGVAHTIVLRDARGEWSQIVGDAQPGGDEPFQAQETPQGIAVEPEGTSASAWITVKSEEGQALVDRMNDEGKIVAREALGDAQQVGAQGNAGPISCPATNDCWLATDKGWLFHLTERGAPALAEDTDPNFAGVITYRPPDPATPQLPPIEPPPDDSLANQQIAPPVSAPPPPQPTSGGTKVPAVEDIRSKLHKYTLELTFKVTVKARVQFLALRRDKTVARTPMKTFAAGKRKLLLLLNRHSWPTKINLKDTPLQPLLIIKAPAPAAPGSSGAQAPPVSANTVEA